MCTTCFAAKLRTGAIESTIATGPSTGISSFRPTSSEQLAVQSAHEALARVHARRPAAASSRARPSRAGRGGSVRPSAGSPRRGSEARRHQLARRDRTRARHARLPAARRPRPARPPRTARRRAARSACRARRRTAFARVGVEQDHTNLAPVAGVDQAGRVQRRDPVVCRQPGARLDEAGMSLGDRNGEAGPDRQPVLPGPSSTPSQATRSSPASPA